MNCRVKLYEVQNVRCRVKLLVSENVLQHTWGESSLFNVKLACKTNKQRRCWYPIRRLRDDGCLDNSTASHLLQAATVFMVCILCVCAGVFYLKGGPKNPRTGKVGSFLILKMR